MTQNYTITTDDYERTVTYSDNEDDEYIDVEITMKEAVDVLNALKTLASNVEDGTFETDLPVQETLNMTRGGTHFPEEASVLIPSNEHARVLMHALAQYDPADTDFTGRAYRAVIEAIDTTPMEFDVAALANVYDSY